MSTKIVNMFRGEYIPTHIKDKTQLVAHLLMKHRYEEPISNAEFALDCRVLRLSGIIFNLRNKGWDIATVKGKEQGHFVYYLRSHPDDVQKQATLTLVSNNE